MLRKFSRIHIWGYSRIYGEYYYKNTAEKKKFISLLKAVILKCGYLTSSWHDVEYSHFTLKVLLDPVFASTLCGNHLLFVYFFSKKLKWKDMRTLNSPTLMEYGNQFNGQSLLNDETQWKNTLWSFSNKINYCEHRSTSLSNV